MSASDTATQQDALQLLTNDHNLVDQLFRQIHTLTTGEARDKIVQDVIRELSVHAAIEEQVLYPAMRKALPNGDALVDEAIQEHQEVKETLAELERMPDAERDALLGQLMPSFRHHAEEEETALFPSLRLAIGSEELRDMGAKLALAKKMAPTHPHPNAPNTPPGNVIAGAAAAVVDKARDALRRD